MSYLRPEDCHSPRNRWSLFTVLEDHGPEDFSVAIGRWDGDACLAMRWNGSKENPVGNPQSRGLPTWFIMPDQYADKIIESLPADKQTLARTLIPALGKK
jgi:hypothetical protein